MNKQSSLTAPEWLGLFCGNKSLEELEMWFSAAADHGFTEVQPAMCWSPLEPADFESIKSLLDRYKLRARCIGIYNDLYKWDGPLQWPNNAEDLITAIHHAPACGVDRLVVWSGSASTDLGAEDARNHEPEALDTLHRHARSLLPLLESSGMKVLFEPWRTHVLKDEQATRSFCDAYDAWFGAVVDPPNFIHPGSWPNHQQRIREILETLLPVVGMVHLKDMTVSAEGELTGLPMFGGGDLDKVTFLRGIQSCIGSLPVIAEHVPTPADIPAMLEAVHKTVADLNS